MASDTRYFFEKKFIFASAVFVSHLVFCFIMKFDGPIYIQGFGIVVTGFLLSQAYVDVKTQGGAQ